MKMFYVYLKRFLLCGALLCLANSIVCQEEQEVSMSVEEIQQTEALQEEIEKDIKESKGSISFDKLFAIWDKTTNAVSKGVSKGASLLDLLPKSLLNSLIQKQLGLKNVSISKGPKEFKHSFTITGTATASGKPVFVTLLYAPKVPGKKKGGNSLSFGIPAGTPLDQIIPGANVSALGTVPITDMRVLVSDFEYTDPANFYPIVSGLNVFVGLDPKGLSILNLESIKSIVQFEGAPILGVATIERVSAENEDKPEQKKFKPTFKVIIPPSALKITEVKLTQLMNLLQVPVPASMQKELAAVIMKDIKIGIDLNPEYPSFSINGDAVISGDSILVSYKIFKADDISQNQPEVLEADAKKKTVIVNELMMNMAPTWNAAKYFPELKTFGHQPLFKSSIRLVSKSYHDINLDADIDGGFDVEVVLDPKSIPLLNTEKVKKIVQLEEASIIGMMNMRATTKEEQEKGESSFKATYKIIIPPSAIKITEVKLSDLIDIVSIGMPADVRAELAKVMLKNITIGLDFTPGLEKFTIDGDIQFFGSHALAVYSLFKADEKHAGRQEGVNPNKVWVNKLSIKMPPTLQVSKVLSSLKSIANLKVSEASLELVSTGYYDASNDMDVPSGLAFDGFVNLSTASSNPVLKAVGNAIGGQIELHGVIPADMANAQFEAVVKKDRLSKLSLSLGDLVPSSLGAVKKELSKASYSLDEFRMRVGGSNVKQLVEIHGTTALGDIKMPTDLDMAFVKNPNAATQEESILTGSWKANLIMTVPSGAEKDIPALDAMSTLPFSSLKMAMIEAPFVDPVTGIDFKEGLNIGGYLGFIGNLSFVKKLFPIKGLDGLNISGLVEKIDSEHLSRNIKLEASIPNASSLKIGSVTITSPKLYISLGTMTAFGIEGSMTFPIPKEFRPKRKGALTPAKTAYIPVTIADIATSVDTLETEALIDQAQEAEGNLAPISEESKVVGDDIFITEEAPPAEEDLVPLAEEALEGLEDDLSPLPVLVDVEEDLSVYDAPAGDNKNLTLTGSLAVSGEAGIMSCAMDGVVDIRGLILKDVGLEGQVVIAAPPVPTGLGFRADMQIGNKTIQFAAKMAVGTTTTSYAWFGKFKGGLYLSDIVNLSYNVAKRAPAATQAVRDEFFGAMNKIPKLGIDELEIAIIPTPTTIAGKAYQEGTLFDMKFVLFGAKGLAKAKMGLAGMDLEGSLDKIAIPSKSPLFIVSNMDGSQGPSVRFVLGKSESGVSALLRNQFSIDGNMEIKPFGMRSATQILMTPKGGTFKMVEKMYGMYETELEGTLPGTHFTKSRLKGMFKQDGLTKLSKALRDASNDFINTSQRELKKARNEIKRTYNEKIEKQRQIVRQEREKATGSITKANQKAQTDINKEIEKARAEIARLEKKIKDKERECNKAKWYRKADVCIKTGAEITGYGIELGAQKTYLEALLKPGKTVTKGTLGAAKGAVNLTPIDSDPRVASLIAAKEAALAGIKIGNMSAQAIGEMGKALATLGDQVINLKSVTLDASFQDLMRLKLPKFSIEGVFFGKKLHVKEFEIDLSNKETQKLLIGKIMNLINKVK